MTSRLVAVVNSSTGVVEVEVEGDRFAFREGGYNSIVLTVAEGKTRRWYYYPWKNLERVELCQQLLDAHFNQRTEDASETKQQLQKDVEDSSV